MFAQLITTQPEKVLVVWPRNPCVRAAVRVAGRWKYLIMSRVAPQLAVALATVIDRCFRRTDECTFLCS